MKDKMLYGYTGLFDQPDEIINAVNIITDKGYKKFDVNSPYPLHGMDKAMKLPPSKLGYAALIFGLSGTFFALFIMFWMSVIDYPLIIGGKPFFAFPAYVPIMFEVTVLSASIATVLTMIIVYFKFPNISHPWQGTEYIKKISSDMFGISIQADDEIFNSNSVIKLLNELGAKDISPVYYSSEVIEVKSELLNYKFIGLLLIIAVITSASTYFTLNKLVYLAPLNWMEKQEKYLPQQRSSIFPDGLSMRKPVQGTIARGQILYNFKDDPNEAERLLKNPLIPTASNVSLGKEKYNIFCSPCHGYFGKGKSRLKGKFPNPPSLHSEKSRNWTDGRLFHIISEGQNVMPSYSSQLNRNERWSIILYMRVLQRAFNAKETDLE
ncbi:quinol:electron acceptor oxidoreductase subunit ActD [Bacteroidota bacterium]